MSAYGRGGGGSRGGRGHGYGQEYGRGSGRGYDQGHGQRGRGGGGDRRGGIFRGGRGGASVDVFTPSGGPIPQPSPPVLAAENQIAAQKQTLSLSSLSLASATSPLRPGFGTKGTPVILWANYVELVVAPQLQLHRYDISVTPQATGRKLSQIIRLLLDAPELAAHSEDMVTDFKSTLLSKTRLKENSIRISIQYKSEGEDDVRAGSRVYDVRLVYTNSHSVQSITEHLTSTNLSTINNDAKLSLIQALNIFFNHYSKSAGNLVSVGSNKTFSLAPGAETRDVGYGLTAVRGFFASVRAATARLLVNVNVSHGVFYQEGPLNRLMSVYGQQNRSLLRLSSFIKRVRVRTTHLPERRNKRGEVVPRIKTILGLATTNDGQGLQHPPRVAAFGAGPKKVEFWLETSPAAPAAPPARPAGPPGAEPAPPAGKGKKKKKKGGQAPQPQPAGPSTSPGGGRYISVYDFFVQTYNRHIAEPDMPVVNAGTLENPTYLPAEVCHVLPGQSANSKLDPSQTQEMIKFAVRKPRENATSIVRDGLTTSGLSPNTNPLLERFGVSVPPKLITVPGRVLPSPKILYGSESAAVTAMVQNGGWNMRDLKFSLRCRPVQWSYLVVSQKDRPNMLIVETAKPIVAKFISVLNSRGIDIGRGLDGRFVSVTPNDDPELDTIFKLASQRLELLFVLLPDANTPVYYYIKRLGDIKYGIHTICAVDKKISKEQGQDQYFNNVGLKVNLKLGGRNQTVERSHLSIINEDKTMIVGIDVTHPSPGSSKSAPSVSGMVASVDKFLAQWPGVLSIQSEARQEMVSDLKGMLKSRLALWKTMGKHAALPENIIVYRDGVSEGQYTKVLDQEVSLLREACKETYPPAATKTGLPRLTVIIVTKRHHTRFYPTTEQDADRSSNAKAGTVVDRGVTEAATWDFFLQSHAAIQGTASSAHYTVILDEVFRACYQKNRPPQYSNLSDLVEDLTLSLCYTYGRATKAISYCSPAYYADLLCERGRHYLHEMFDPTPTHSTAGSVDGSAGVAGAEDRHITVHSRLTNTMFYI